MTAKRDRLHQVGYYAMLLVRGAHPTPLGAMVFRFDPRSTLYPLIAVGTDALRQDRHRDWIYLVKIAEPAKEGSG